VRLTRDGYMSIERRVVIAPSRSSQVVTLKLSRPRATVKATDAAVPTSATPATIGRLAGTLDVESRPSGAKVYMDGRLVGSTPVRLADVPAGEHAVHLERDGYKRWASSVRVTTNERNRVTASLEK
jgi:hypothetical protein